MLDGLVKDDLDGRPQLASSAEDALVVLPAELLGEFRNCLVCGLGFRDP